MENAHSELINLSSGISFISNHYAQLIKKELIPTESHFQTLPLLINPRGESGNMHNVLQCKIYTQSNKSVKKLKSGGSQRNGLSTPASTALVTDHSP